ncbi:hypothetical protein GUJ93_ZPchr0002g24057 [Zizania palustris]|uniref:Uncharacterized protein n=1 Tax=Zizania palustris TaxID=103762 RepID=A0A8J5RSL1_ZIZPA|nr:hypothetical protein GUJ93_ZPchr0002g24057 [Zizania palustris]
MPVARWLEASDGQAGGQSRRHRWPGSWRRRLGGAEVEAERAAKVGGAGGRAVRGGRSESATPVVGRLEVASVRRGSGGGIWAAQKRRPSGQPELAAPGAGWVAVGRAVRGGFRVTRRRRLARRCSGSGGEVRGGGGGGEGKGFGQIRVWSPRGAELTFVGQEQADGSYEKIYFSFVGPHLLDESYGRMRPSERA